MSENRAIQIYLETSVISAYHYGKGDILTTTKMFFDTCARKNIELYSSDTALREIEQASKETTSKLLSLLQQYNVRIYAYSNEADKLAEEYLRRNIIPTKVRPDAQHIAICTVNSIEVLASWNLRHIVNLRTKMMVKEINTKMGYITPNIVRPDEVLIDND